MRRWICLLIVLGLAGCRPDAPPPVAPAPAAEAPAASATAPAAPGLPAPTPTSEAPAAPTPPSGSPTATQGLPATSPPAAPPDDSAAVLRAAREAQPRDAVALARSWGLVSGEVALPVLPDPAPGDQAVFWATNTNTNQHFQVTATLRVSTDHLLMYVAADITATDQELEEAAATFEGRGWPLLSRWYDQSALPARPITVLNANIPGVGGYYAADNELPRALNPYSNEREIVFINASGVRIGSQSYIGVLIHEIQHLLQRNTRADPATWFNEGSSMLSEYRAGYGDDALVSAFLAAPDVQLNGWADSPGSASRHYGAAELFLRYLDDQIGGLSIGALARSDAGDQLEQLTGLLAARYPDLADFADVYAAWAVANLINDPSINDGRYGYPALPQTVQPQAAAGGEATI
ncbi:MAG TPA: hypothetical protein VD886_19905, partial [Herpetosiphonaceae bacterium]|nr:hypothetical protein [Herpetosiphonaceae bacterium]